MKVSDLIRALKSLQDFHGDIPVVLGDDYRCGPFFMPARSVSVESLVREADGFDYDNGDDEGGPRVATKALYLK